jgi:hypothetical protein
VVETGSDHVQGQTLLLLVLNFQVVLLDLVHVKANTSVIESCVLCEWIHIIFMAKCLLTKSVNTVIHLCFRVTQRLSFSPTVRTCLFIPVQRKRVEELSVFCISSHCWSVCLSFI